MRSATFASAMFLAAADTFLGYASRYNLGARIRNVNTPRDGTTGGGQRNSGVDAHDHSGEGDLVSEVPPTQVFDNLYFLGTAEVNTWLYGTEAGFVLIDGMNNDEEAAHYVLGGMAELGHTPGTISPILEVFDNGTRHAALLWGGTGFNFGANVQIFETYAQSAAKMREASFANGVDVFISAHPKRDGSVEKLAALTGRQPGEAHPFVWDERGYDLFDVLENCALAQAARFSQ